MKGNGGLSSKQLLFSQPKRSDYISCEIVAVSIKRLI